MIEDVSIGSRNVYFSVYHLPGEIVSYDGKKYKVISCEGPMNTANFKNVFYTCIYPLIQTTQEVSHG